MPAEFSTWKFTGINYISQQQNVSRKSSRNYPYTNTLALIMVKYIVIVICTLSFLACKNDIENNRFAVMQNGLGIQDIDNGDYKNWNPSGSDVRIAEVLIIQSLMERSEVAQIDSIINNLSDYYFQLVPFLNYDGEKIILVEALCSEFILGQESPETNEGIPNWTTDLYFINEGGGKCFWELKVNIDHKYYYDFAINSKRMSN